MGKELGGQGWQVARGPCGRWVVGEGLGWGGMGWRRSGLGATSGKYEMQTQKTFNRTLIYYDTDTQSANFRGNPLRQATKKRHLNNS